MQRRCLVEQSDQGPIPMSTDCFETFYLKLRKWEYEDPWHLLWRSILNGLKGSGVYSVFSLGCIYLNYKEGPWNGHKWFQTLRESWADMRKTINVRKDSLVKVVAERLERFGLDRNEFFDLLEKDDLSFMQRKGNTVAPSRWWSWQDAMLSRLENPLEIWAELTALLHHGVTTGYLIHDKVPVMCGLTPTDGLLADDLRGQSRNAAQLRSRCKNTIHAVTVYQLQY